MVKRVDAELKIEVREDMRAASITASIRPETPVGTGRKESDNRIENTAPDGTRLRSCHTMLASSDIVLEVKQILFILKRNYFIFLYHLTIPHIHFIFHHMCIADNKKKRISSRRRSQYACRAYRLAAG